MDGADLCNILKAVSPNPVGNTECMLCIFDCAHYFSPRFADSDSGSAFPATAGAAECHGLHQQGSQPSGPHRHRGWHQCRHRKTARLSAFLIPSTESVRRETRSKHSPHHIKSEMPHIDRIPITPIVLFFFFFAFFASISQSLNQKAMRVSNLFPWTTPKKQTRIAVEWHHTNPSSIVRWDKAYQVWVTIPYN